MLDNPIDDSLMQYISLPSGAWTVLVRRVYYSTAQRKLNHGEPDALAMLAS